MFTTAFARDLLERALSTFAQALIAAVAVDAGTGIHGVDWVTVLSVAALAAVLSVAKGLAAYKLGDNETGASLLSDPPPRVERGAVSVVEVLLIVLVVMVILALLGVL